MTSAVLRQLVTRGVIPQDSWDKLNPQVPHELDHCPDLTALADRLLNLRLLTPFQAGRVRAGNLNGLVLGNYRVLEKIGSGGMGIVFRAEQIKLKNVVAIKALFLDWQKNRRQIDRFFLEVRAVAMLRHSNIVAAIDAGEEPNAGPDGQPVPYLVMEYIAGRNLDDLLVQDGPLPVARACHIAHQIADALTEAHRQGLVHRDIKPSNLIVTPEGQAKLLDFGVARLPSPQPRLTQEGTKLGTVGYMAPEQARNPRDVDVRADIFGLGATLFFMLTAHDPFAPPGGALNAKRIPRLLDYRSGIPTELEEVLARMMALNPAERIPTAAAVMRELTPFLSAARTVRVPGANVHTDVGTSNTTPPVSQEQIRRRTLRGTLPTHGCSVKPLSLHRVLLVDDEEPVRRVCRLALQHETMHCEEVAAGNDAVTRGTNEQFDLVLLDVDLPELSGEMVLRKLRENPGVPNQKIIMLSGRTSGDNLSRLLAIGADDYLTKPFSVVQLRSRVKAALRLKDAQDRSDLLAQKLASANRELEQALQAKTGELVQARGAISLALAKLVEQRSAGSGSGSHLLRLQRYCRVLAQEAATTPAFRDRLEPNFIELVETATPLHDIGTIAVSDCLLNKLEPLTHDEQRQIQQHTTIGAATLAEVSSRYPFATAFFQVAIDIARYHHERWDGRGYPEGLVGEAIPISARLLAIADAYDALRMPRGSRPALSHLQAVQELTERSSGRFDPALLEVFRRIEGQFNRIFSETAD